MKVIICGAGQVGYGIAEHLSSENNDVAVIDNSPELIQRVSDALDVRGFVGHGSHPDILDQSGAADADMIIAATYYDEVNMVACQVAHSLFNIPTKIARIRSQSYLESHWQNLFSRQNLPIDVIISPEVAVGEMILQRLKIPGAFDAVSFGDGLVSALGISCGVDCPVVDTPLKQLTELFPDLKAVVGGISRQGKIFAPHGNDQLLAGDDAYVFASTDHVDRTLKIFGHEEKQARRVVIAGGGNIGLFVASRLESLYSNIRVKVVEIDRDRALNVADQLKRTVVLNASALEEDILREADIQNAGLMLALTDNDQVNILSSVLAKRLGCERALALVNNRSYMTIVQSLGIDAHVNPRSITVSRILQHVRRGRIRNVHSLQNGAAEILEAEALQTSPVVGRTLRELNLTKGIRIGAIIRDNKMLMPLGETIMREKDRAVIFATADQVRHVEQMFRVSLEYF